MANQKRYLVTGPAVEPAEFDDLGKAQACLTRNLKVNSGAKLIDRQPESDQEPETGQE